MAINDIPTYMWKAIYETLDGNAALVASLGHTPTDKHIGRIGKKKHLSDPCVTFGQLPYDKFVNQDQPRILSIRRIYYKMSSYSTSGDDIAINNMELVLAALVGERMSESGYKSNPIEWDDFMTEPYFDENEQACRVDARIKLIVRQCSI